MAAVHVYFADPERWQGDDRVLSDAERERAGRFRFEHDRRLYVVAHAMLRQAIAEHAAVAPESLRFVYDSRGKPDLEPRGPLRFSLAHARGMAVCAVAQEHDVGIDVEPLGRRLPEGVAERCFSPEELRDLQSLPDAQRAERFFVHWTLKEAYAKGRGLGLALPFEKIAFRPSAGEVVFQPEASVDPEPSAWRFESFRIAAHQVAIALRAPSAPRVTLHAAS